MSEYFAGEKLAGLVCATLGILAIGFSVWLFRNHGVFRAMMWPLGLVGLIQLAIGLGLYFKTGPQVAAIEASMASSRGPAIEAEKTRMDRVMKNFTVIEIFEAVLIVAAMAMIFAARSRPGIQALGMGLIIQASVMLAFDVFAEQRGKIYLEWLQR